MRFTLFTLAVTLLIGCATSSNVLKETENLKDNVIAIGKNGNPVDPLDPDRVKELDRDKFQNLINRVLATQKRKIIIYIHGGLNTPRTEISKANEILNYLKRQDVAPFVDYKIIFINWRSGLLTTYYDHLFNQRQGENWPKAGFITAPFVFTSDIFRGVAHTPSNWLFQTNDYMRAVSFDPCYSIMPSLKNATYINCLNHAEKEDFGEISQLTDMSDSRSTIKKISDNTIGALKLLAGLATAPLFDAIGSGAWSVMKQRTEVMFVKQKPDSRPEYSDIESYDAIRSGALSIFLTALEKTQKREEKEIVLVGHSMGSIVANNMLLDRPNIKYSKIIYMAAACSIKDFSGAVVPYLKNNPKTNFYNYSLHPVAENLEDHLYGFGGTGSLLNQIDNIYETPVFENHRTLGKWVNIMNGINYFNTGEAKSQIFLRTMALKYNEGYPTEHGEFDEIKLLMNDSGTPAKIGKEFWTENYNKQE